MSALREKVDTLYAAYKKAWFFQKWYLPKPMRQALEAYGLKRYGQPFEAKEEADKALLGVLNCIPLEYSKPFLGSWWLPAFITAFYTSLVVSDCQQWFSFLPQKNPSKEYHELLLKALYVLHERCSQENIRGVFQSLLQKTGQESEAYLNTILRVYELGFNEAEIHLLQRLPQDTQPYRNTYVYSQLEEKLYYIDFVGHINTVLIHDMEYLKTELEWFKQEKAKLTTYDADVAKKFLVGGPFLASITDSIPAFLNYKPKKEITRLTLSQEKIKALIISNGGHVPHVLSDEPLFLLMKALAIYENNLSVSREGVLALLDFIAWQIEVELEKDKETFAACNHLIRDLGFSPQDLKELRLQIQDLDELGFLTPSVCEDLRALYLATKEYSSPIHLELSDKITEVSAMIKHFASLRDSPEGVFECFEEELGFLILDAQEEAQARKEAYYSSSSKELIDSTDISTEEVEVRGLKEREAEPEFSAQPLAQEETSKLAPPIPELDNYAVSASVAGHSLDTLFSSVLKNQSSRTKFILIDEGKKSNEELLESGVDGFSTRGVAA